MPTYDYECDTCAHTFEVFQSISEPVKRKCPACGKKSLRRLIGTGAALIFKGSGFYKTDYRSDSYRKGAEADKPASGAKSGEGSKGADSSKNAESSKGGDSSTADKSSSKDKGESKSKKKKAE